MEKHNVNGVRPLSYLYFHICGSVRQSVVFMYTTKSRYKVSK